MMSELTRLHDEALRLLTIYEEHKDSEDAFIRRKAYVDLDRFLMAHRETAMLLVVKGLQAEIDVTVNAKRRMPWYRKILKGGGSHGTPNDTSSQSVHPE